MKNYRIEVKWALVFMAMMLIWMLIEKMAGLHSTHIDKHVIYTNFVAIPAIAVYVFAMLDKKRNFYNGTMSYKQGFVFGLIMTFIIALLNPVTQSITSLIITPEYFPNVIKYAVSTGEMTQTEAEDYFNLEKYIIQGTIGAFVMGLITTVIVAFFVKSKATSTN